MEISRYPDLSVVKAEPPSPCVSPVLPMLPPPAGKGKRTVEAKQCFCWHHLSLDCLEWRPKVNPCLLPFVSTATEFKLHDIKSEPPGVFFGSPFGPMSTDSKQGLVSVAITLRPAAAEVGWRFILHKSTIRPLKTQLPSWFCLYFLYFLSSQNITGVVAAISDLLCVKIPSSYEVSSTPDRGPPSVFSGPRLGPHGMDGRPPMLFKEQADNSGLQGRPGHMMRPGGGPAMMMQQQQQTPHNFRFHPDSPGQGTKLLCTMAVSAQ